MRTFLSVLGVGVLAASVLPAQNINVSKENRTIAITATDSTEALADQAVVNIGYLDYGTDEASAYSAGSKRSNDIVNALEKVGIPRASVESLDQQLEPLSEYEIRNLKAEQKSYHYRVSQSWTVKTEPERASKILDIAVKAGANQSGSIGWQMKDPDVLGAQAAEKAIAHAQRIAAQMAAGLHIKLGPLVYASNTVQPREIVSPAPMMAMARKVSNAEPMAINARHISESATVYAVFAVE